MTTTPDPVPDPSSAPEHPRVDDLPVGAPFYAIEWETDDPSIFLRDHDLYVARGAGSDKEVVALRPEFPERHGATEPMQNLDYEELWSLDIGEAQFAVSEHLYEEPRVAVVRQDEALLVDGLTGEVMETFELPGDATGIDIQTFDSFFIDLAGSEFEQLVLTSTGDLLPFEDWVVDFPDDVTSYGVLQDWVLPAGEERKGMLHIRGDDYRWRFDGTDPAFVEELGLGPDYILIDGKQGYSNVYLQYARGELDIETGTYTSDDVAVVRVDDGEVVEIHHGAVICGEGICAGEFAVAGGVVEKGADVMMSAPDRDETDRDDSESVEVPVDNVRQLPTQHSAVLPGGEYEAIELEGSWPSTDSRSPLFLTHDDADPFGIGADAVVACQRTDGLTGAAACSADGEPLPDDLAPMQFVTREWAHVTDGGETLMGVVTDEHILLAPLLK